MIDETTNLLDFSRASLGDWLTATGRPAYRAKQVYRQLYVNLVDRVGEMTDLPLALRDELRGEASIGNLRLDHVQVGDGGLTRKALFRLPEGEAIETVLMLYPDRATVCVSSQAGCPMGCVFCATAKLGFLRDLTTGQIVEQVLWAARTVRDIAAVPARLTNVVFMGMGESFNNYDNWWGAVERLHDPDGFHMGARSFTVSTVGLVPGIQRLATEALPINLAISLHAANDAVRSEIMPVNRAYPIRDLLAATRDYTRQTGRRVSFEYVLLEKKNDSPEQAGELAKALCDGPMGDARQLMHVNLIPWNPVPGSTLARSSRNRIHAFQRVLQESGVSCTVRVERGVDIDAACGQLAGA